MECRTSILRAAAAGAASGYRASLESPVDEEDPENLEPDEPGGGGAKFQTVSVSDAWS